MSEEKIIGAFAIELRSVRGLSENTIQVYTHEARNLLVFLEGQNTDVFAATREHLIAWRESMQTRAASGMSIAFAAARSLFDFLKIEDNFPKFKVRQKKQEPTDVPTVAQFLAMRELLKKPVHDARCVPAITRQALFETLAGSALRISALLSLRRKHLFLDRERPYVMVVAGEVDCKGKSAGQVPLSPYAARVMALHLSARQVQDDDLVFDLSEEVVRKILNAIAPSGLKMKPHSLRHYCCSMWYYMNFDGGRHDIVWVRDGAGHASVSTTDGYLKMARRVVSNDTEWRQWAYGTAAIIDVNFKENAKYGS